MAVLLPGAVGADETERLAARDHQRDVVEGRVGGAVPFGDARQFHRRTA